MCVCLIDYRSTRSDDKVTNTCCTDCSCQKHCSKSFSASSCNIGMQIHAFWPCTVLWKEPFGKVHCHDTKSTCSVQFTIFVTHSVMLGFCSYMCMLCDTLGLLYHRLLNFWAFNGFHLHARNHKNGEH